MKYLTNKKLIISIIIASGIIGGAFWYTNKKTVYVKERSAQQISNEKQFQQLAKTNKDSDGDGLKDWEEALWGSDPNNQDTDNDGSLDGEEIAQNRNPLIPGPDDNLSSGANRGFLSKNQEDLTLTEKVGGDLMMNYFALKKTEDPLDPYAKEELVKNVMEELELAGLKDKYGLDDILTNSNISREAINQYTIKFNAVFEKYFNSLKESELAILTEALNSGSEGSNALEKFKPYELAYKNATGELLKIRVPESYAQIHLSFINNLVNVEKSIIAFQDMFTDPFQAMQGVRWYIEEEAQMIQSFLDLRNKLAKDNIGPNEENIGYVFAKN